MFLPNNIKAFAHVLAFLLHGEGGCNARRACTVTRLSAVRISVRTVMQCQWAGEYHSPPYQVYVVSVALSRMYTISYTIYMKQKYIFYRKGYVSIASFLS